MRFVTAEHDGRRLAGLLDGEQVIPLDGIAELGADTPRALLADPPLAPERAIPLADVRLLPPVPNPRRVICVGLNYKTHVHETGRELPTYPVLFTKFASSLLGPSDPIALPPEAAQVDWEAELAVVIGERCRRVPRADALDVVAGYTVANDVTMRDYQYKTHQWLQGKAWDRSTPLGPALVTPDEVGDPGALEISLTRNGETMQAASTSKLIFDVATLIATVSEFTTLDPGDVLLTGTPGGVGYRRDPQVFLADGDVVAVEISRVGRIESRVTLETA